MSFMTTSLLILSIGLVQSQIISESDQLRPIKWLQRMNAFGPACGQVMVSGLTEEEKQLIVDYHNDLRRRVAGGLEDRGFPGPQPPATNMKQMIWDDELADMAQIHAQQCQFQHDENRYVERFRVGQNIAMEMASFPSKEVNWEKRIGSWYDEVDRMNPAFVRRFPWNSSSIGHYSQIVWAESYAIGCGLVGYYDQRPGGRRRWYKWLYVCNYGPAGNFIDQPVYKIGPTASECPTGTSHSDGLCRRAEE